MKAPCGLSSISCSTSGFVPRPSRDVYSAGMSSTGLIQDAQVTPVAAAELSEFADRIGKRRQLLLNDEP